MCQDGSVIIHVHVRANDVERAQTHTCLTVRKSITFVITPTNHQVHVVMTTTVLCSHEVTTGQKLCTE